MHLPGKHLSDCVIRLVTELGHLAHRILGLHGWAVLAAAVAGATP